MEWVIFKTFDDRANAELLSDRLKHEGVANRLDYGSLEVGIDGFSLYVPSDLLDRAKLLTADAGFTDDELNDLAKSKTDDET